MLTSCGGDEAQTATAGVDVGDSVDGGVPAADDTFERLAERDLFVELTVPGAVEPGVEFDVEVLFNRIGGGIDGPDLRFDLPEGLSIVGGVCPAGEGVVECLDVDDTGGGQIFLVPMVWNPPDGSTSTVFSVSFTDQAIDDFGFDRADGNPDNNVATAELVVG